MVPVASTTPLELTDQDDGDVSDEDNGYGDSFKNVGCCKKPDLSNNDTNEKKPTVETILDQYNSPA